MRERSCVCDRKRGPIIGTLGGERRVSSVSSVTRKKLPNVYKSCPKNDFTRKMLDFDTFTKIA